MELGTADLCFAPSSSTPLLTSRYSAEQAAEPLVLPCRAVVRNIFFPPSLAHCSPNFAPPPWHSTASASRLTTFSLTVLQLSRPPPPRAFALQSRWHWHFAPQIVRLFFRSDIHRPITSLLTFLFFSPSLPSLLHTLFHVDDFLVPSRTTILSMACSVSTAAAFSHAAHVILQRPFSWLDSHSTFSRW
ncbi:hypothetical protein BC826DRAFT_634861 [Russula brevipes]|nr:hypothetical protein BC826DRAFT_634861 [Russula brevipes]